MTHLADISIFCGPTVDAELCQTALDLINGTTSEIVVEFPLPVKFTENAEVNAAPAEITTENSAVKLDLKDMFSALTSAYEILLKGIPNFAGYQALMNSALFTNYGSNNFDVNFNGENVFINLVNNLVQGNTTAQANFNLIATGTSLQEKLTSVYKFVIPADKQTAEGLAYFTRPEGIAFFEKVAAERGVAGADGAAIIGLASLLKIANAEAIGIGNSVEDLIKAIATDTSNVPASGEVLIPLEDADGTMFDADDNGTAAKSIALTTRQDYFKSDQLTTEAGVLTQGGSGDDVYQSTLGTLNSFDFIDGGSGNDTLRHSGGFTASSSTHLKPTIIGVETLELSGSSATASGFLDLALSPDIKSIVISGSSLAPSIASPSSLLSLSMNNVSLGSAQTIKLVYNDATVSGSSDMQVINLNNVNTSNSIAVYGGVETFSVNVTGSNSLDGLSGSVTVGELDSINTSLGEPGRFNATGRGDLKTINVQGSGSLKIDKALDTSVTTFDGSAASANLDVKVGASDISVKGGSGNDIFVFGTTLTSADAVDGGGGVDVLQIAAGNYYDAPEGLATRAALPMVKNIETLRFAGSADTIFDHYGLGSLDQPQATFKIIQHDGPGDIEVRNAGEITVFDFGTNSSAATTAAKFYPIGNLNVSLTGSTTDDADIQSLDTDNGTTVNLISSGGTSSTSNDVGIWINQADATLAILGSGNTAVLGMSNKGTIDGNAATGNLTLVGSSASDTIKGGSGNDNLSGGAGAAISDTLTGNGGQDRFQIISGNTEATADVITDFVSNVDKISFAGPAGSAGNFQKAGADVADFTAALNNANVALDTTILYSAQQVGTDTYLFWDQSGDGNADQAVKLIGVSLAGIAANDIVA